MASASTDFKYQLGRQPSQSMTASYKLGRQHQVSFVSQIPFVVERPDFVSTLSTDFGSFCTLASTSSFSSSSSSSWPSPSSSPPSSKSFLSSSGYCSEAVSPDAFLSHPALVGSISPTPTVRSEISWTAPQIPFFGGNSPSSGFAAFSSSLAAPSSLSVHSFADVFAPRIVDRDISLTSKRRAAEAVTVAPLSDKPTRWIPSSVRNFHFTQGIPSSSSSAQTLSSLKTLNKKQLFISPPQSASPRSVSDLSPQSSASTPPSCTSEADESLEDEQDQEARTPKQSDVFFWDQIEATNDGNVGSSAPSSSAIHLSLSGRPLGSPFSAKSTNISHHGSPRTDNSSSVSEITHLSHRTNPSAADNLPAALGVDAKMKVGSDANRGVASVSFPSSQTASPSLHLDPVIDDPLNETQFHYRNSHPTKRSVKPPPPPPPVSTSGKMFNTSRVRSLSVITELSITSTQEEAYASTPTLPESIPAPPARTSSRPSLSKSPLLDIPESNLDQQLPKARFGSGESALSFKPSLTSSDTYSYRSGYPSSDIEDTIPQSASDLFPDVPPRSPSTKTLSPASSPAIGQPNSTMLSEPARILPKSQTERWKPIENKPGSVGQPSSASLGRLDALRRISRSPSPSPSSSPSSSSSPSRKPSSNLRSIFSSDAKSRNYMEPSTSTDGGAARGSLKSHVSDKVFVISSHDQGRLLAESSWVDHLGPILAEEIEIAPTPSLKQKSSFEDNCLDEAEEEQEEDQPSNIGRGPKPLAVQKIKPTNISPGPFEIVSQFEETHLPKRNKGTRRRSYTIDELERACLAPRTPYEAKSKTSQGNTNRPANNRQMPDRMGTVTTTAEEKPAGTRTMDCDSEDPQTIACGKQTQTARSRSMTGGNQNRGKGGSRFIEASMASPSPPPPMPRSLTQYHFLTSDPVHCLPPLKPIKNSDHNLMENNSRSSSNSNSSSSSNISSSRSNPFLGARKKSFDLFRRRPFQKSQSQPQQLSERKKEKQEQGKCSFSSSPSLDDDVIEMMEDDDTLFPGCGDGDGGAAAAACCCSCSPSLLQEQPRNRSEPNDCHDDPLSVCFSDQDEQQVTRNKGLSRKSMNLVRSSSSTIFHGEKAKKLKNKTHDLPLSVGKTPQNHVSVPFSSPSSGPWNKPGVNYDKIYQLAADFVQSQNQLRSPINTMGSSRLGLSISNPHLVETTVNLSSLQCKPIQKTPSFQLEPIQLVSTSSSSSPFSSSSSTTNTTDSEENTTSEKSQDFLLFHQLNWSADAFQFLS